jgi:beta-lactamase superfamily II metal-dependent hydrolase
MLTLRVVQARYGDCLILENGSGKRRKNILIDGGPDHVYQPYLRKELQRIAEEGGQIDLLVLSHIDNDHVLGLLELMTELKDEQLHEVPPLIGIRQIWHNTFRKILPEAGAEADELEREVLAQPVKNPPADASSPEEEPVIVTAGVDFGVGEGVKLQLADEFFAIPRNIGFTGDLITLEKAKRPVRLASLKMWMIGPCTANLDDLGKKWLRWLDDKAGRVSFDVSTPLVEPDDSVNNLSSIMFLAEAGGRSILLTGDGRSQDIIAGLEAVGKLEPGKTCHVDVMKVPHHGSARNAVGELFDRVLADMYVFSADGKYGNPDWETLVWLVDAACRQQRKIHMLATNWTPSLKRLIAERPGESNFYNLTVMPEDQTSFVV